MHRLLLILFLLMSVLGFSQTLPSLHSVDWTLAGLRDTTTHGFLEVDMGAQGVVGDGTTPNDAIIDNVLSTLPTSGAILKFPAGNFLFHSTIVLPNNIVIRGEGAEESTFKMDLGGSGHSFSISGRTNNADTTSIIKSSGKDNEFLLVSIASSFSVGDWIRTIQLDSDLVTSSWAEGTVGQIIRVKSVSADTIFLESPLRMDYDIARAPYIVKVVPAENVGLECLKILRIDDTAPQQTSNVFFSYAVNCWVSGIESENCTFSHITTNFSSNLQFSKSYFHHAFGYGGGGRAYGVMLQLTSNECLVENNVFEHLRHSMIVQAGSNGNVFSYNYSLDPFWDSNPSDAAGDVVLHGNYVYANLFEQNICQNIVIDNSHGPNGPHNTMLRNRAEGFGIFFSADNSPNQNFIGNEIPNRGFPYSFVNYNIQGDGHFIHGNNNKGTIDPVGTNTLIDSSYAYLQKPDFVSVNQWAGIGTPNLLGSATIPAFDRFTTETVFSNACNGAFTSSNQNIKSKEEVNIYPNPVKSELTIKSPYFIQKLTILNVVGNVVHYQENIGFSNQFNTNDLSNGVYYISIEFADNTYITEVLVKSD